MPAEARRARILDAALAVFADAGYAGASMHAIAHRAGVVPSVIYDHFPSKRELYIAIVEARGEAAVVRTTRQIPQTTPQGALHATLEAFFSQVEEDRFFWRFLLRDPPADPEIAQLHQAIKDRATHGLAALVDALAPEGDAMRGVPRERWSWMLALASLAAANGLAGWWYEHPEVPRDELVTVASALLWEGFGGLWTQAAEGGLPGDSR